MYEGVIQGAITIYVFMSGTYMGIYVKIHQVVYLRWPILFSIYVITNKSFFKKITSNYFDSGPFSKISQMNWSSVENMWYENASSQWLFMSSSHQDVSSPNEAGRPEWEIHVSYHSSFYVGGCWAAWQNHGVSDYYQVLLVLKCIEQLPDLSWSSDVKW